MEKEFMEYVVGLENKNLSSVDGGLLHGFMGVANEAGELMGALKKHMAYKTPLDKENVKEELGDLLHYMVYIMDCFGWTFSEIMEGNMDKLKKRYPNGYSNEDALERKDKV